MGRGPGEGVDPARLRELAGALEEPPEAVARTLRGDLLAARARIDAGLADGSPRAIGDGAHAARNSALMVGAGPLIAELRALQTAADAGDLADARAARERVQDGLARLIEALGELA